MRFFLFILLLFGVMIFFFLWQYVFSIYEVFYKTEPEYLYISGDAELKVESVPLNALGFRAPFRNSPFTYEWESGKELVEIVKDASAEGFLILKSTGRAGTAVLKVKGKFALLASIIEIRIAANLTDL